MRERLSAPVAEWYTRIRYRDSADRVVRHEVVETAVMGRAAVLNLAFWLGAVSVVQIVSGEGSELIDQFGGMALSFAWAIVMLLGALLVMSSRPLTYPLSAVILEVTGMGLIVASIAVYAVALVAGSGPGGAVFVLGLCVSSCINLLGRCRMLVSRDGVARRVVKGRT